MNEMTDKSNKETVTLAAARYNELLEAERILNKLDAEERILWENFEMTVETGE